MLHSLASAFIFTGSGTSPALLAGWAAGFLLPPAASVAVLSLSARGGAFAAVQLSRPAAVHVPVCSRSLGAAALWPAAAVICPAAGAAAGSHCWSLAGGRAAAGRPTVVILPAHGFGGATGRWLRRRGFQRSPTLAGVWLAWCA